MSLLAHTKDERTQSFYEITFNPIGNGRPSSLPPRGSWIPNVSTRIPEIKQLSRGSLCGAF